MANNAVVQPVENQDERPVTLLPAGIGGEIVFIAKYSGRIMNGPEHSLTSVNFPSVLALIHHALMFLLSMDCSEQLALH